MKPAQLRTPEENQALPEGRRALVCYRFACNCSTHAEAERLMIARGYADDPADFDAKVREIEDQ